MSDKKHYQQETLRRGLLSGEDEAALHRLYHHSPDFHNGIDTIAGILPIVIDALAKHSVEQQNVRARMMEEIQKMPPLPTFRDLHEQPDRKLGEDDR